MDFHGNALQTFFCGTGSLRIEFNAFYIQGSERAPPSGKASHRAIFEQITRDPERPATVAV
jgi:hypothetical protein